MSMLHYLTSQAGVLVFGERGAKGGTESVIDALRDNDIPHDVMSGAEANARYPDQLKLPNGYICAFEGSGGILRANKAVATFQVRTRFIVLIFTAVFASSGTICKSWRCVT